MIDYGLFQLACPPFTALDWLLVACETVGLGKALRHYGWAPFGPPDPSKLRVSLVRHPCRWLADYYRALAAKEPAARAVIELRRLDRSSWQAFAADYLRRCPGAVGRLFDRYEADVRIRQEDLPWCLVELLGSLHVPWNDRSRCFQLPAPRDDTLRLVQGADPLWVRIVRAERRLCETCEYY